MRNAFLCITALLALNALNLTAQDKNNFKSGEKLKFVIYFGLLDAGYVDSELVLTRLNGREVYHSRMTAKSSGLADKLYKVRDEYQSWFDPSTLLPVKSLRDINEGKYKQFDFANYYHQQLMVINSKKDTIPIPADVKDMLATFYQLRNVDFNNMKDGQILKFNTFFDNELFPFDMRYRGKEVVKTRMGTYRCIKLVPFVEPGRIFHEEDDMTIWISDDQNRVPIRVRFDLKVGSVKCDLIEFSGLKY
jgi:hypothetical protein